MRSRVSSSPSSAADLPLTALHWLSQADQAQVARRYDSAIAGYRQAIRLDASLFDAWYGLGSALLATEEFGEAVTALRQALTLRPDAHRERVNLGTALYELGRATEAVAAFQRAAKGNDPAARSLALANLACLAPCDPACDNRSIRDHRRRWFEAEARQVRPIRRPEVPPEPNGRLRIAYHGSFFAAKNWMKMYMGMINAHDRDRFEITLIADGPIPSAEGGYQDHPNDRIWDVTGLSNAELAGHIAAAGIDVLVDLLGYSHQARITLPLWHAAPVQLAWQGLYGTSGTSALTAVIGDPATIPPAEERFCVEPVHRVPATYLPFHVFYDTPPVAPMPWRQAGHVTFGGLAPAYKVNDAVVASWSRILHGVPTAKLLMRNRALSQASNRADLLGRFAARGIGPERLVLEGGADHDEVLRTYDRIDIALDSFPYNGGTSTAEALWQGVPLLTFNGDRWASRTSRSLLLAAGLGEWVADDLPGFEAMAIRLGQAPEPLVSVRGGQRERVAASAACDPAALCRALERVYIEESLRSRPKRRLT